jgi:hypothetical protein
MNLIPAIARGAHFLVFLWAAIFLAAQFHDCTDLMVATTASHICSACSTMDSFVAAPAPHLAIAHVSQRLEIFPSVRRISLAVPRAASLRAPPTV